MKKLVLSMITASVLSVSANAMCASEKYCTDFYLGAGGFYDSANGSGTSINNAGGFIALGGSDVFFSRLQLGADMKFGYGSNRVSGANLATFPSNNNLIQVDLLGKLGVNIAGIQSPLFVNFIAGEDLIISNNGVGRAMVYIGASVDGRFAMSERVKLIYSAGYGYIVGGGYLFDRGDISARLNGYNQLILASLGTQIKMSENLDFYLKIFGKYYDLQDSRQVSINGNDIRIPSTTTWQAGVEAGIAF